MFTKPTRLQIFSINLLVSFIYQERKSKLNNKLVYFSLTWSVEACRQSKLWFLCSTSCEQSRLPSNLLIYSLYLLFLVSNNGPRCLPNFSHQVCIKSTERREFWGKGCMPTGLGGVTLFFRSNQAALRPLGPYNCKEAQETVFFFFLFFSFSG